MTFDLLYKFNLCVTATFDMCTQFRTGLNTVIYFHLSSYNLLQSVLNHFQRCVYVYN